jgi:antitoxin ParD1/3/4
MNISITPELEKFVQDKVKSGMYNSASELVREALRLLAERDELRRARIEKMDAFIQAGLDEAARGEHITPAQMKANMAEFKRQWSAQRED